MDLRTGKLITEEELKKLKAIEQAVFERIDAHNLTEKQLAEMQVSVHDNKSYAGI